jgi:hypothetical protein
MVPIRELPYGPAATYGRITRPDRWQHPTTRQKAKILLLLRGRPQMSLASPVETWRATELALIGGLLASASGVIIVFAWDNGGELPRAFISHTLPSEKTLLELRGATRRKVSSILGMPGKAAANISEYISVYRRGGTVDVTVTFGPDGRALIIQAYIEMPGQEDPVQFLWDSKGTSAPTLSARSLLAG